MIGYLIGFGVAATFIVADWLVMRPVMKRRIADAKNRSAEAARS